MNDKLKKNTIWNTIGITFNSFNSLFFLIIINRINGVNTAGIFSFSFSIACLLYIVGIYSGRIYQVSDTKKELTDMEYLVHKIITCLLMVGLSISFIIIRNYSIEKNIVIIILTLYKCLEAFDDTLYGYFQKNDELHIVGKSLFFKSIVGVIFFAIVDIITHDLVISCIALTFNSLLFVIFYDIRKAVRYIEKNKIRWNRVLKLFKIGFSVFAFSFLAVYIVNIQKYIIDILLDDAAQTVFGIIVMPGTIMSLCGQYITAPLLTEIVKCYKQHQCVELKKISRKIVGILLILGILVEVAAWLLGIPVLNIVYAIDLNQYKMDLIFIIMGALFYAVAGIYSTILITMRKNNMQLVIYIADSIVGVIISYYMISMWKLHGATVGYVLTMTFDVILYKIYYMIEYKKWTQEIR